MMTEKRFWEIVKEINWREICHDKEAQEATEKRLANDLSPEDLESFRALKRVCWNNLDKIVGPNRNPAGGGDDAHSDLLNHIIGLGQEVYNQSCNHYSLIQERGEERNYVESFAYVIPCESTKGLEDYEVYVEMRIVKKVIVSARSIEEAEEKAHEVVDPTYNGDEEKYREEIMSCRKVQKKT